MRNVVVVETNEGVRFTLTLAGPVSRSLAWAIDQTVVILGCILTGKLIGMLPALSPDLKVGLTVLSYFVIWIAYGICLEWKWAGQTIGKHVLKLRVMDGTGRKLVFSQIAIRNLMRFLDALPFLYFVGGLAMLLNDRYQRIGDLVANTIVLRDRQTGLPDFAMAAANEKYNSLLEITHLAARLRQKTPPELLLIAYEAVMRRDQLDPAARIQLFAELAQRFRSLVKYPPEITEILTDEGYVRSALGVIAARKIRWGGPPGPRPTSSSAFSRQLPNPQNRR